MDERIRAEIARIVDEIASMDEDEDVELVPNRTRSGKVLTDADVQALADEAERGYDVSQLRPRRA